ncbi:hypothetical protein B9J09_04860 [Xylella fastidiosa subsp. pauca]|nr:hypothetical protein B9J09_04860 [Xylella fastidiosa subsp. pauca]
MARHPLQKLIHSPECPALHPYSDYKNDDMTALITSHQTPYGLRTANNPQHLADKTSLYLKSKHE